jgi:hypothetical protein
MWCRRDVTPATRSPKSDRPPRLGGRSGAFVATAVVVAVVNRKAMLDRGTGATAVLA